MSILNRVREKGDILADRRKHPMVRALFSMLPNQVRFSYMRDQLKIPEQLDSAFTFKVATTQEELSAAYRILHESYLEQGYTKPNESGMRIVKYFALPSTTTLIALYNKNVVGTISIVRRGSFGLPMENTFNLAESIDKNKVIAEISSLAIDAKFRKNRGALFLPLLKFFWEYIQDCMKLDAIVITVNPSMSDFYEAFLNFKRLKNAEVTGYSFANGNPGVGLWMDVQDAPRAFKQMYIEKSKEKNLFSYFVELRLAHFEFPNRDFYKSSDPVMTPDMLSYFFKQKSNVFAELSAREVVALNMVYPGTFYSQVLPDSEIILSRDGTRYAVNIQCKVPAHEDITLSVVDVAREGLRVVSTVPLSGHVLLRVLVGDGKLSEVMGEVRWQTGDVFGLKLIETDYAWQAFSKYLKNDFEHLSMNKSPKAG